MKTFLSRYKFLLFLIVLFIVTELIVNPTGNFPLNDDWAYARAILTLEQAGYIDIGHWPAMTLFTQIIWGSVWVKIFGFSFFILRISTLVSSLVGIVFLYKLISINTGQKSAGIMAALILLFNPLYFSLSNTFMTDVNFNTLMILCFYFAYDFFSNGNRAAYILVFVLSALLVLLRQYGVIFPISFTFACLFLKSKRISISFLSLLFTALIFGLLKYYEAYLKTVLTPEACYKYSGDTPILNPLYWKMIFNNLSERYKMILVHLLFYISPFAIFFVKNSVKNQKHTLIPVIGLISIFFCYLLFRNTGFQMANIFTDMSLGAETFYETINATAGNVGHTYSVNFERVMTVVKFIATSLSMFTILFLIINLFQNKKVTRLFRPDVIILLILFCAYIFMLLVTESYFDRYHLPLVTLAMLLFSFAAKYYSLGTIYLLAPIIFMYYVSVFGTKDYFTVKRLAETIYSDVKKQEQVEGSKIQAGFEIANWNEGRGRWWAETMDLNNFDYLIQYQSEPRFSLKREYPFQRFFPYEEDTLRLFKRTKISDSHLLR